MPSKVYFINARVEKFDYKYSLLGRLEQVLRDIDLSKYFSGEELVPIKMHLGNKGGHSAIRPNFVKLVIDKMKEVGAKPFVTDSARVKPYEYLEVANEMGYNSLTLGVPVIIADGIFGFDSIKVKAGKMLKEISIPSAIHDASAMMVLTHVKGHIDSSLGGAIKNLGMGCVSALPRSCHWKEGGRGKMHFLMWDTMEWDEKLCTFCGICANNCPMDAITIKAKVFEVNDKKCVRCGRCVKVCPEGALKIPFSAENFQKGMAESVKAVLSTFKPGKVLYVNFILDVQPECDCMLVTDTPVIQDQGILVSDDIVAIDQATMDIIQKAASLPQSKAEGIEFGKFEDILSAIHQKDAKIQIVAAEKLGLGSRKYKLIEF
jgi:uncharacterized protein